MQIDQELVRAVTHGSGTLSAEADVEAVVRKHLLLQQQEAIRGLPGSVSFWPDYDHKKIRENRFPDEE